MSRTCGAGSSEILGAFIGKEEVEAALQGSHSDREAMARRITSSLGYNGYLAYVQGDDLVGHQRKYGLSVADAQKKGLHRRK
jgi:hypothetical protein